MVQDPLLHNTVFTLWICLLVIWSIDLFPTSRPVVTMVATGIGCLGATFLQVDYGATAIVEAVLLYFFYRKTQPVGMALSWGTHVAANQFNYFWLSGYAYLLILHHYRGRKGKLPSSLWYWFYPLHLVLLQYIQFMTT